MFGFRREEPPLPRLLGDVKKVQDSLKPDDWKEDLSEANLRDNLRMNDSFALKRQLYPFSAQVKLDTMGLQRGAIFMFARLKMVPGLYPIEVWFSEGLVIRKTHFASHEAEIIPPLPEQLPGVEA